jgi:hypothetical protein
VGIYGVPEFYIAAGAEGDGIGSATITGLLMSQIVLGQKTTIDVDPLRCQDLHKVNMLSNLLIVSLANLGTFISTPLKSMPEVTMVNLCGRENTYRMLVARVSTEEVTHQEWVDVSKTLSRSL